MEPETPITKKQIVDKLKNGIVNVLFLKANGEEREMKATLLEEHLPTFEGDKVDVDAIKKKNDEVVVCWDMDKQAWRSFRVDSVITVS